MTTDPLRPYCRDPDNCKVRPNEICPTCSVPYANAGLSPIRYVTRAELETEYGQ